MKRIAATLFLALSACAPGEAPVLSEITLSRDDVRRGEELFATVMATDLDGDLDRAKIAIKVSHDVDDGLELESEELVSEVPPGTTTTNLIVGMRMFGAVPLGRYRLELIVEDNEENESEPAIIRFMCRQ
jgi:hypothetical protein